MRNWIALATIALALALAVAVPSVASADPSGPNVQQNFLVSCDNGTTFVANGGALPNRSREAFVVDSTSIFVLSYLAFTGDGETYVIFDIAPGRTDLVTCTWTYDQYHSTGRGFFTPRD
jgi:hypothetical protein